VSKGFEDLLTEFHQYRSAILSYARGEFDVIGEIHRDTSKSNLIKKLTKGKSNDYLCQALPTAVKDALFISRNYCGTIQELVTSRQTIQTGQDSDTLSDLFWPKFYLSIYQDLPRDNFDPWIHFLESGIFEGRSPHPLLDVSYLESQMRSDIDEPTILRYFLNSDHWKLVPNQWTDIGKYFDSKDADESSSALPSILYSSNPGSYIDSELLLIDATGAERDELKKTADAYYLVKSSFNPENVETQISKLSPDLSFLDATNLDFTAFPGFGIVASKRSWCSNDLAVDESGLALRMGDCVASPHPRHFDSLEATRCIFFTDSLFADEISELIAGLGKESSVLIPVSKFQSLAFKFHIALSELKNVEVADTPTVVHAKQFEMYSKSKNLCMENSKTAANSDFCLLAERSDLVAISNRIQKNDTLLLFDQFHPEIAKLLSQREQLVVASRRAIDLFAGYLDSEKTIELERWILS
jgi:hypothetical protein